MVQRIAFFVIGYYAVQHANDYRTVRKFQSEKFPFQLSETGFVLHRNFYLLLALFLLAENTYLFLVFVVLNT